MSEFSSSSRFVWGRAHTDALVLPTLVSLLFIGGAAPPDTLEALVRWSLFATPLLISVGFFLSVLPAKVKHHGPLIGLLYRDIDARRRTFTGVLG